MTNRFKRLKLCPMCGEPAFVLKRRTDAEQMSGVGESDKYECHKCGYAKEAFTPARDRAVHVQR